MKSSLYLDKRHLDKKGMATLKIKVCRKGTVGMISLFKIDPSQWKGGYVVNHPNAKHLNSIIKVRAGEVEKLLMEMAEAGEFIGKSGTEACNLIKARLDPEAAPTQTKKKELFRPCFIAFMMTKSNQGTKTLLNDTLKKIDAFCEEYGYADLIFSDINRTWLSNFESFCLRTQKQNTASRHLRDIRAAFNAAIDDGITTCYPFRKFKIKKEKTIDKSYTAAELRILFMFPCYEGWQQEAVDIFMLMFCLIGINSVDLANANDADINHGRLNYKREKTHKPYSIKIEPEAEAIINKYKGKEGRLLSILNRVPNYKTYFNRMGKTLKKVGLIRNKGMKNTGKALLPDICTGSARTSWATIAQEELGIPREVIAAALGHHTVDVTSTYLRTDWKKKVDEANRRVLDWVIYKKKRKK